ncbi:50S ribosomal protein L13 [Ignicoccus hospitalis]|uniref:Large ribosomal subunit protein uL13 n=1 Tax=Ignicoccus hospitalis (strain KIN4/I / DSM 18386 / JCM 14125) TaxID=453591 RepID=A8A8W7_IGNH4|nr:50S ribosomal protein L13 [Ignicoccus hospitalis]ABU81369.1 LSU ribosomal protein L13P [Ignicoccus hospitalis KIN4/I]HIH90327.1 50S ribosomal protein L13 [Desulfurococcaceae archaeon]
MKRVVVIDATNQIVGRMASHIAKMLLEGWEVNVINAEKAVLSGEPTRVVKGYQILLNVKTHTNPYRNKIKRPRTPIAIIKDAVKGMLPKHNTRGREALKRLKVYIGEPEYVPKENLMRFPDADALRLSGKYITVGEVARRMGWKGGEA